MISRSNRLLFDLCALLLTSVAAEAACPAGRVWSGLAAGWNAISGNLTCNGRLGDVYALVLLDGENPSTIPLPINFYWGETRFTSAGEAAVAELAEAVKEQNLRALKLVGHTDPSGNARLNLNLSLRRAEAVRMELIRRGVTARIDVEGKGAAEPFDVSALDYIVSREEAWELDRRVEFVPVDGGK